jgi:hypothetical protein
MATWLEIRDSDGLVVGASIGDVPPLSVGHTAIEREGDEWIGWTRQPDGSFTPSNGPVDLYSYAAGKRWELIEGHRLQLGPFSVPTDKVTRDTLTAAYVKAAANPAYQITDWKVSSGVYVTLDAATIVMIADAVEAYVQAMFTANRAADEAIEAGTATTTAQVDAILGA